MAGTAKDSTVGLGARILGGAVPVWSHSIQRGYGAVRVRYGVEISELDETGAMAMGSTNTRELDELATRLEAFVAERDWAQFHSPKNLSMALAGEVGELIEHFQWLTEEQSRGLSGEALEEVRAEIADVQIYLLMLARKLDIDLLQAARDKLETNAEKYPVEKARGRARKYTNL